MAVRPFCTDVPTTGLTGILPTEQQRISVERCVAELRAGRPVRVRHGAEGWLVNSAETALCNPDLLEDVRQARVAEASVRLVLPMERLNHLGSAVSSASSCDMKALPDDTIQDLVLARSAERLPELTPATVLESVSLDLMKFAQLLPAAIVTELIDGDAFDWTLNVSVDALRTYHHEVANSLELVSRAPVPLKDDADTEFVVFRGTDGLKDQVAIVVGRPDPETIVPVRLHSACLTGDLFGSLKCDCGEQLRRAIQSFSETGGGVLLYLDQEGRGIGLSNKMRAYKLQSEGYDTVDADAVLGYGSDERRYEIAAQMVALLGYKRVSLLTNNPRKIAALGAHGIQVVDRIALVGTVNPHNERYLKVKMERAGHLGD